MSSATHRRPSGGTVTLVAAVTKTFAAFVQTGQNDSEAGGVLLGRLILDSSDVIIDVASRPHSEDKRSRFFFWRSNKPAQRRVIEAWQESSGTQNYLGEWHTHPEDVPTPSCVDIQNWKRLVKRSKFEQEFLLFIIVGRRETGVWEARKGGRIELLPLVAAGQPGRATAEG
jgi:integrative and conjugative element protein (TIGR02256 family)